MFNGIEDLDIQQLKLVDGNSGKSHLMKCDTEEAATMSTIFAVFVVVTVAGKGIVEEIE